MKLEDNVIAFAFEPSNGKRFGIIHAMSPTASRTSVSFYSLADGDLKKLSAFLSFSFFITTLTFNQTRSRTVLPIISSGLRLDVTVSWPVFEH